MRKIKVMIASMIGAIALVFACVFGTRINAETIEARASQSAGNLVNGNKYVLTAANVITDGTVSGSSNDKYTPASTMGVFAFSNNNYTPDSDKNYFSYGSGDNSKSWTKGIRANGDGRTITVTLLANQKADFEIYCYSNKTGKTFGVSGSTTESFTVTDSNTMYYYTTSYSNNTDSTKSVAISFPQYVGFTEIDISTSALDMGDFTSLTVTNFNTYYTGDEFETSDLLVTAVYERGTKELDSSKYSYVFSPALVDGKFASATTYTLTVSATIDNVQKTKSIDIVVADAVRYTLTFKKYSTDTDPYATVSNIVEGETVGNEWPANPRVLNKTFVGWFDGDTEYTSSSEITSNITLIAKYTELKNDLVVFGNYTTGLSSSSQTTAAHNIIDGVDASGNSNKKIGAKAYTIGDVQFNGTSNSDTFIQCGEITFTLAKTSMVTLYATQTGNKSTNNATTYVINASTNATVMDTFRFDLKDSDSTTLITAHSITLPAGTYKTVQSGLQNWYGIRVNQDIIAADTTASVFAEMNNTTGTLRFVGKLTGVTNLDNIASIELVLKKDGVATNSKIYLTTCYTSVTGTTQDCAAANGTYYVIFRLNNANSLATGTKISKELIITFTDGSTTTSNASEITM